MKTLALVAAFIFSLTCSLQADEFETELVRRINVERGKYNLAPLQADNYLMEVARLWARDIAQRNKLEHRGKTTGVIMQKAGYSGMNENLYFTTFPLSAESTVTAWMNSPGHRKNLLNDRMTIVGVGYAPATNGAKYVVFNSAVEAPEPQAPR